MREHLNTVIDAWVTLYDPQVSKAEVNALKDTLYTTTYQYIKDSNTNRKKWRKLDETRS